MKRKYLFIQLVFIMPVIFAQSTVLLETKSSNGTGHWTQRQAKLVNLLPDYVPVKSSSELDINTYGSSNHIFGVSTGFFHTMKINNRWWIIDPEGKAGFNIAMNSVYKLENDATVAAVYNRLWALGYNGIGNFLSDEDQTIRYNDSHTQKFSYTRRINFFLNYRNVRKSYYPSTPDSISGSLNYVFVLDPKFEEYCDALAKTYAHPYKEERNLLGYFIDNEINFNQDQLYNFLHDLKPGDPSYDAALSFIQSRGILLEQVLNGSVSETIKQAYATRLAEHYYEVTSAALKKYDPNHMNLGSRLHGRPRDIEGVVKAAAKWCDVVSINFYDKYSPNDQLTSPEKYMAWIDVPCIVSEFYVKGFDATTSGFVKGYTGAGWVTKTQVDRGHFYQNTCLELLKSKKFVGWHYFKYQDDQNSNKGIVKTSAQGSGEYTELTDQMTFLNNNRFKLVEYFDAANQ